MNASLAALGYLLSGVLFIMALRGLSSPATSRRGNLMGMLGMVLAVGITLAQLFYGGELDHLTLGLIGGGVLIGWTAGAIIARSVKMTAMPQMVSMFNGMGGACAAVISMMEFPHIPPDLILKYGMMNGEALTIMLGLMIGSVSFSGSTRTAISSIGSAPA